jgi:quinol monooxygenase YgiN
VSTHVVTDFRTKPGKADELIAILAAASPDSLTHHGCEAIRIRREQDDPSHVVSFTQWETRQDYDDYLSWRTDSGLTDEVSHLLTKPMSISYFDELLTFSNAPGH